MAGQPKAALLSAAGVGVMCEDKMSNWIQASADTLFYDKENAYTDEPYEVYLSDDEIRIRYEVDGEYTTYIGREIFDGHFELTCPPLNGKATLHRFPKSSVFEGFWTEEGVRGAWRIRLHEST